MVNIISKHPLWEGLTAELFQIRRKLLSYETFFVLNRFSLLSYGENSHYCLTPCLKIFLVKPFSIFEKWSVVKIIRSAKFSPNFCRRSMALKHYPRITSSCWHLILSVFGGVCKFNHKSIICLLEESSHWVFSHWSTFIDTLQSHRVRNVKSLSPTLAVQGCCAPQKPRIFVAHLENMKSQEFFHLEKLWENQVFFLFSGKKVFFREKSWFC